MIYDLVIIGGGPAGVAAGVYAARKKIKAALITDFFGGQSLVSADIQNWIGAKSLSGLELAKALEDHLRAQKDIKIITDDLVTKIEKPNGGFLLSTREGKTINAKIVLITSGSRRKRLNVPGEDKLDGKGVAYCSTCDAPLFGGKDVAVIGGGNSALEAAMDLAPYANKIYLIHRGEALKGDSVTEERIKQNSKTSIILNAETKEIVGKDSVQGIRYKNKKSGEVKEIAVQGVFVKIGSEPNSEIAKDFVKVNEWNEIIIDHKTGATSCSGIWAAGDVTDVRYKQNNISAGDAIKALLNIRDYLNTGK